MFHGHARSDSGIDVHHQPAMFERCMAQQAPGIDDPGATLLLQRRAGSGGGAIDDRDRTEGLG